MAPHSSTLAWKIPWMQEPDRLQSMGSLRVGLDWVTSLSLFNFMHWRRNWQPTPVFLPGESHGGLQSIGLQRPGHRWSELAYIHTYRSTNIYNQHPKDPSCAPSLPWDGDYQAYVSHNLHAILPLWQLQTQKPLNIRNLGHCLIDMPPPHFEFRGEMTCSRSRTELQNLNLFLPVQGVTKSWTQLGNFHVHTL